MSWPNLFAATSSSLLTNLYQRSTNAPPDPQNRTCHTYSIVYDHTWICPKQSNFLSSHYRSCSASIFMSGAQASEIKPKQCDCHMWKMYSIHYGGGTNRWRMGRKPKKRKLDIKKKEWWIIEHLSWWHCLLFLRSHLQKLLADLFPITATNDLANRFFPLK